MRMELMRACSSFTCGARGTVDPTNSGSSVNAEVTHE
jgi:hypothetical protein